MTLRMSTTLSWRSALLHLTLLATLASPTAANCTNYTAKANRYNANGDVYSTVAATHRVSEIVDCTGAALGTQPPPGVNNAVRCNSTQCALYTPAYYYVESMSYLNISTPNNATYDSIATLLRSQVQTQNQLVDWNRTVAIPLGAEPYGQCRDEGQASYIAFTPFYLCTEGVLSGCTGEGPTDGTAILACGLKKLGNDLYDGQIGYVQTGATDNSTNGAAPPNATIPDNGVSTIQPAGTVAYLVTWVVVIGLSILSL